MSTFYQMPAAVLEDMYVHQTLYPTYYTAYSTNYTYSDFKYEYIINTTDGAISKSKSPPRFDEGIGRYSPNSVLDSLFGIDFQPEIKSMTTCTNSILEYTISMKEFSSSISPSTITSTKAIALKGGTDTFDYRNYNLTGNTSHMLTDWTSTRKVTLDDWGTLRLLSGQLKPIGTSIWSRFYEVGLQRTNSVGDLAYYTHAVVNPYYGQYRDSNLQTIEDVQGMLFDIPAAPANLSPTGSLWNLRGYQLTGQSSVGGLNVPVQGCPVEVGDKYEIYAYCWPYGTNGRTSKSYKFEVVASCASNTPIQIQWENFYGAYDFFRFDLVNTKSLNISKSTYRKDRDSQGSYSKYLGNDRYIGHSVYDRGETVFNVDIETNYIANTDWIDKQTINDLESLWTTKDAYAYINNTWYPIIVLNDAVPIGSTRRGLRQYQISFRLANKTYR